MEGEICIVRVRHIKMYNETRGLVNTTVRSQNRMRRTTRIQISLRLVAAVGVLLIVYGTLYQPGHSLSNVVACLGLVTLLLAIVSAFGLGPIGKRLRILYVEEKKEEQEEYKRATQPWETKK